MRRRRKPEPGLIVLDLRPMFRAFDMFARALRRAGQPKPVTPHCREHEAHAMSCISCVNALAGLSRQ